MIHFNVVHISQKKWFTVSCYLQPTNFYSVAFGNKVFAVNTLNIDVIMKTIKKIEISAVVSFHLYCYIHNMEQVYMVYSMQMSLSMWMYLIIFLTHWLREMHICISNLTIIGSNNGLSPGRRQTIIWSNAGILLTWHLGTNFSEIWN